MTQRVTHGDEIKSAITKGQGLAQTLDELQRSMLPIFFEHPAAGVQANQIYLRHTRVECGLRYQTGAGGHVQHTHARFQARLLQRAPSVRAVCSEGNSAARPIVMARGAVEELIDETGPFSRRRVEFSERGMRRQFCLRSA